MPTRPSQEEIARVALFASLSADEQRQLAALAELEVRPAGSVIFVEGDPPGDLYVVLEGRVMLCMRVPGQPETCFLSLRGGELLGWSALLKRSRVATARAVAPTKLLRFPIDTLLAFCDADPRVGYAVVRRAFEEIADRLQGTRLQLLDMFGSGRS